MRRDVKTIAAPVAYDTAITLALVLGLFGILAAIGSTGGPRQRPCSSWRPSPASADSSSATPPVSRGSSTNPVKIAPPRLRSLSWSGRSTLPVRRNQHPEWGSVSINSTDTH